MNQIIVLGSLDGYESNNRVYDVVGLAPTIGTMQGGDDSLMFSANIRKKREDKTMTTNPKICVAMRGREGGQTLEPRPDQCTNTITSVTKDNLIVEALDNEQNNLFKS